MATKTKRGAKKAQQKQGSISEIPAVIDVDIEATEQREWTKYETHVKPRLDDIYIWMKEGMTEGSICKQLGISKDTWIRYKKRYSEICDLYTRAQEERNELVLDSMYQKATGYKHPDLFIAQYQGQIVEKEIVKHYPPDHNAADLYLRNRMPGYVSTRPELSGGNTFIQNNVNINQIKAEMKELVEEIKKLESPAAVSVEVIPED